MIAFPYRVCPKAKPHIRPRTSLPKLYRIRTPAWPLVLPHPEELYLNAPVQRAVCDVELFLPVIP